MYFLTFEYTDQDWRLTYATNGRNWTADVENGVFHFKDYYKPDQGWQWDTECGWDPENACRLTEFYFDDLEEMAAGYARSSFTAP